MNRISRPRCNQSCVTKETLLKPTIWIALKTLLVSATFLATARVAPAQGTTTWTGANTAVDMNWSDAANWTTSGGSTPPGPTDSVIFGNGAFPASTNVVGATNSIVTANTTIGALSYLAVSPNTDTTEINSGATLTVNGTFTAGVASSTTVATMVGTGNFTVNNLTGNFNVGGGGSSTETATLTLADGTNTINVGIFSLGESASNNGRQCTLNLGAGPTIINADTNNLGTGKASGTIQWLNAAATNSISIHNHTGTGRAVMMLGHGTSGSGSSNGKLLAAGHPVNILASTITLGQLGNTSGTQQGTLTFDTGTVDATSVLMEIIPTSGVGAGAANGSQLNVGGNPINTATLIVNSPTGPGGGSFIVSGSSNSTAGRVSSATFSLLTNGTALVYCPIAKVMAANNTATINISGTLNMEAAANTIGSRQVPIDNVIMDFATLDFGEDGSSLNLAAGTLTLDDTNVVNFSSLPPITHTNAEIPIITYTSLSTPLNIGVGTLPGNYQGVLTNDGVGTISLVITSGTVVVPKQDEWLGVVNTNWDVTTLNWTNAGLSVTNYTEEDFVTFDDKGLTGNVTLLGNQHTPSGMTVNNSVVNYVLSGAGRISGDTSLIKTGTASLRLSETGGDNFAGGIYVHGGTFVLDDPNSELSGGLTNDANTVVQVGNNDGSGTLPLGTVQNNGSLVFQLSSNSTVAAAISGSGTVTQNGSGVVTLTNASTYTGNTAVNAGTLALSAGGSISSTPSIAVQNATLDISTADSVSLPTVTVTNGNFNVGAGTNNPSTSALSISNSTITLIANYNNQGGSTPILAAGNLSTGGSTNMLNVTAIQDLPITATLPFTIPLISYTSATFNSGFNLGWTNLTGISGYITNNTAVVPNLIELVITNAPQIVVWNGGSATDNNWSDPANWTGATLQPLDAMTFDGLLRTNNMNDTLAGTTYAGITFNNSAGAAPFTLNGAPINLVGTMINNASTVQTVNLGLLVSTGFTNDGGGSGGSLRIAGGVTNTSASGQTVTLVDAGTLADLWATNNGTHGGGQLEFQVGDAGTAGNWTIVDGTGTGAQVLAGNVQLSLNSSATGSTLNFGTSNSSPNVDAGFTNTASVVSINGATATFNMNSGTLKVNSMAVGSSGTATATFNMNGGTLILGSGSFAGTGGNGASVATMVVTNGSVYSTNGGAFTLAQRGASSLTVSNGLMKVGTLSLTSGTAATGTGTVGLGGGILNVTNISVGSSAANGWGVVYYNGGTLQVGTNSGALFKQNNLVPLTNAVQIGGAVIDTAGFSGTFNWPMISDPALGGSPDGGLVKIGTGALTLSAENSYIGNTTVSSGTLIVSGSLSNGTVTVTAAGTLGGSGTIGGPVTVNGTIAPGNSSTNIGTLTITTNVTLNGTAFMKLNGSTSASDNLAAPGAGFGSIALGGMLVVSNISATPLQAGQVFTLFTTPTLSGSFTSIQPATPGAGLAWNTNNLGVNGTLSILSTGPTTNATITKITLVGTNVVVQGTNNNNPNTNFHYVVLTSTNVAAHLSNWVPVFTNSFNSTGTFDYTNPVVPGIPNLFIDVKVVP